MRTAHPSGPVSISFVGQETPPRFSCSGCPNGDLLSVSLGLLNSPALLLSLPICLLFLPTCEHCLMEHVYCMTSPLLSLTMNTDVPYLNGLPINWLGSVLKTVLMALIFLAPEKVRYSGQKEGIPCPISYDWSLHQPVNS